MEYLDEAYDWPSTSQLPQLDPGLYPSGPPSHNQPAINNGEVPNQTNVSTAQSSQPTNISSSSLLGRNCSSLSETKRAKKRKIDQAYREKCKKTKEETLVKLGTLTGENESLKKENESFKKDNALMNETLREKEKVIGGLRSYLCQLKHKHEKQIVLLQALTELLADPVRLKNDMLKGKNASLENASLSNLSLLAEENAKLSHENKVLKVQNHALCEKIISDNDKKCEQEH